jgi:putative resolvase
MKLSSYAKRIGISYNTAWRMWKRGQIPGSQLPTGTVIIDPPELRSLPVYTVAVYARVSTSREQEAARNASRAAASLVQCGICWSVGKVVNAGGSGINDQRPKFLTLLADLKVGQIVVDHKDRASHFGVASIQTLLGM